MPAERECCASRTWMLRLRKLEQVIATRAATSPPRIVELPQSTTAVGPTPLALPPTEVVPEYDPFHTGVAHFQHIHRPQLVTFVFAAGRHEPTGTCTFMTVDFGSGIDNPFATAVPQPVDAGSQRGTYTWVSTATTEHARENGGVCVTHYALFSGGNSHDPDGRVTMQSLLYAWHEQDADGSLETSQLLWVEPSGDRAPARFCLLADLGALYDCSKSSKAPHQQQLSHEGNIDIIITGYLGISIYSRSCNTPHTGTNGNLGEWVLSRRVSLPPPGARDGDGVAYTGVAHLGAVLYTLPGAAEPSCLIVGTRSEWSDGRHGERPWQGNAPSVVYDFRTDRIMCEFDRLGQTVSVGLIDGGRRLIVGTGGQAGSTGQPNFIYDICIEEQTLDAGSPGLGRDSQSVGSLSLSLALSSHQLVRGMLTDYVYHPYGDVDDTPTDSIAPPTETKTRQVLPFSMRSYGFGDFVLEVNSAQPCCIWARDVNGVTFALLPLPYSQGSSEGVAEHRSEPDSATHSGGYARAADVLVREETIWVVLANFNGRNTVYEVPVSLFVTDAAGRLR